MNHKLTMLFSVTFVTLVLADPIIIDHTCTDLTQVPQSAIQQAKDTLVIAYGHTSHGSQLTTGMSAMTAFINGGGLGISAPTDFYSYNSTGSGGALQLRDTPFTGASDLGNPDRVAWEASTRTYLNDNPEVNVIIWSWCGQVDGSEADIDLYLSLMNGLEIDYPDVQFVYMTGHLNGGGASGNVNIRNQQIRDYCIANDKILYDFADIESYDPDGLVNYMVLLCNDNCDYDSDDNGSLDKNWATDWQNSHTQDVDWYSCSAAHSQPLNGNRKAYAAWWLWARLAGWMQCVESPSNLTADYNDITDVVTLGWTDNSSDPNEDMFVIQRQVDANAWDVNYVVVPSDITTYNETLSIDGTYRYRVISKIDSNGIDCNSSPSNVVTVVRSTTPPDAPSGLGTSANGYDVTLSWTDNSNDEQVFVVERRIDTNSYEVISDTVPADSESYIDYGLTVGPTYTYRVLARNSYGDSGYSNESAITLSAEAPNAPSGLSATLNGNDIDIVWTDNSNNEDVFVLERQVDTNSYSILDDTIAANSESYTDIAPVVGHTYTYRVFARNTYGDSAYSNMDSVTVPDIQTIVLIGTSYVEDSFLQMSNPSTNYGSVSYLSGDLDHYIFKFDFPSVLEGKRIVSADLAFYLWSQDINEENQFMQLYRVSREWNESSVTWNDANTAVPWVTPGGDYDGFVADVPLDSNTGDHAFIDPPIDITATVQNWVREKVDNYGLLLVNESLNETDLKTSEYSSTNSTRLTITYSTGCPCDFSADIDYDCTVNLFDFAELGYYWRSSEPATDIAPVPRDGIVDYNDLQEFTAQWLEDCP